MPESIRTAPVKFEEIAKSASAHVEKHNAKPQTVLHRIDEWVKAFGTKPAESIPPEEIDKWLNRKDAATANRLPDAPKSAPVFAGLPRYWWEDVRIAAKIPDYRWHDHRHTLCSRLAMAGVNLVVMKELAGHKTLAVTARYAHLDDSAKRKAVEFLVV